MKISVVIVNYNCGEKIIFCLRALLENYGRAMETVVVDNHSTDGSMTKLKAEKLPIKVIENKKNLGFAAGANVGIRYALVRKADAVLLLNPDAIVSAGFLELLLKNPADIVSPVLKFKRKEKWVYDLGGKVNWWLGRTTHHEVKNLHESIHRKIDYVSGCAMLIKRRVFEKIGFLDERYFLYFEDVDFCLRAKKTGLKVAVELASIATHQLTEGKKKKLINYLSLLKSNFIFINLWLPIYRRPLAYLYLLGLLFKILI